MSLGSTNSDNFNHLKGLSRPSRHPIAIGLRYFYKLGGITFPKSAGRLACKMWFKPRHFPIKSYEYSLLEQANTHSFQINPDKIVTYYEWGCSEHKVLIVHGWESRAGQFYQLINKLIEEGYSVIAFDAPAHGNSTGKDTDILEYHEVLQYLQKKYGKFDTVVAHSFGAVCSIYAMANGFQVEKSVFISVPSRFKGLVFKFQAILGLPDTVIRNLCLNIEKRFKHVTDNPWHDFSADINAKLISDRSPLVKSLIVHDKNDKEVPYREGRLLAESFKDSQWVLTENLGHKRLLNDERLLGRIVEFVSDTQPS